MPRRKSCERARIANGARSGRNERGRFEMDLHFLIDLCFEPLLFEIASPNPSATKWMTSGIGIGSLMSSTLKPLMTMTRTKRTKLLTMLPPALLRLVWTNAANLISGDARWKAKGANVNIRGAGTSERTFYRRKLQKRNLEDDAAKSNSILKYCINLPKAHAGDCGDTADDEDDNQSVESVDSLSEHVLLGGLESREGNSIAARHSLESAIEFLDYNEGEVRRNARENKNKAIDMWYHTCAIAIKSYLAFLQQGFGKMIASIRVAAVIYSKPDDRDSYKAQSIRAWGEHYLLYGEVSKYKIEYRTFLIHSSYLNLSRADILNSRVLFLMKMRSVF